MVTRRLARDQHDVARFLGTGREVEIGDVAGTHPRVQGAPYIGGLGSNLAVGPEPAQTGPEVVAAEE
jgi:hypothetical protein